MNTVIVHVGEILSGGAAVTVAAKSHTTGAVSAPSSVDASEHEFSLEPGSYDVEISGADDSVIYALAINIEPDDPDQLAAEREVLDVPDMVRIVVKPTT